MWKNAVADPSVKFSDDLKYRAMTAEINRGKSILWEHLVVGVYFPRIYSLLTPFAENDSKNFEISINVTAMG